MSSDLLEEQTKTAAGLSARSNLKAPGESSVPNRLRPSNPFTPSSEPDWVLVSKPRPRDGSKDRPATHREVSKSTTNAHQVVPRFEPIQNTSSALTNDNLSPNRKHVQRMSSEDSAVSVSSLSRKQAPPIPKKPSLLSPPVRRQASSSSQTVDTVDQIQSPPPGWKTSATIPPGANYPPPPRRTTPLTQPSLSSRQTPSSDSVQKDHDNIPSSMHLNGRKLLPPEGRSGSANEGSYGLLDDDDNGVQGIPSLQPFRRS